MPFSGLEARVAAVRQRIEAAARRGGRGQEVLLIAVTKSHEPEAVRAAWRAGIRDVGENKVQEALAKQPATTGEAAAIRWHLIGHLQRNKVKFVDRFALFHALDSERLAEALHAVGERRGRPVEALVEVNVSGEGTKGGFTPGEIGRHAGRLRALEGVRVTGVMTMAPFGADETTLRRVFRGARDTCDVLALAGHPARELSMGMSDDFEIAVEEGATMVRLGTVLFGARTAT